MLKFLFIEIKHLSMFIKYLFPLAKIKYLVSENMFKKYRANMQSVVLF